MPTKCLVIRYFWRMRILARLPKSRSGALPQERDRTTGWSFASAQQTTEALEWRTRCNPIVFTNGQSVRLVCPSVLSTPDVGPAELTAPFSVTDYEPLGTICVPFPLERSLDGDADQG